MQACVHIHEQYLLPPLFIGHIAASSIHLYWSHSSQQESSDQLVEDNKLGAAATNQEKYSTVLGEVWLLYACFVGNILWKFYAQ
jgi:hypothetical protein